MIFQGGPDPLSPLLDPPMVHILVLQYYWVLVKKTIPTKPELDNVHVRGGPNLTFFFCFVFFSLMRGRIQIPLMTSSVRWRTEDVLTLNADLVAL